MILEMPATGANDAWKEPQFSGVRVSCAVCAVVQPACIIDECCMNELQTQML